MEHEGAESRHRRIAIQTAKQLGRFRFDRRLRDPAEVTDLAT
jgi:hypothetical protein